MDSYTEQGENHGATIIIDEVSYSTFLQYCRVILSRYSRTLLLAVFSRAITEYFCLWASIGATVFPFQPSAVNTIRYTSSFQDSKTFLLAKVFQHIRPHGGNVSSNHYRANASRILFKPYKNMFRVSKS